MFKFLKKLLVRFKNRQQEIQSKKEYHYTAGVYTDNDLDYAHDERLDQDMKDLGEK